jgi:hypothetical protein
MQNKNADHCIAILVAVVFDPEEIRTRYVPNVGHTRLYRDDLFEFTIQSKLALYRSGNQAPVCIH